MYTTICVLKTNILGLKVTMCDSDRFLLFFLFTYSREKIIGYDKHYCAVACSNSPNEMNPFHQHVPPPCCIILITHGPLHNWNKQELPSERWRGERADDETEVTQADGEISAEIKETGGLDGRLEGKMKGYLKGLDGKNIVFFNKNYQIKGWV